MVIKIQVMVFWVDATWGEDGDNTT